MESSSQRLGSNRVMALSAVLVNCRGALIGAAFFSALVNILYLTGSFFMLEVYDRVLPSRSVPTLVGFAILVTLLYAFQGVLDLVRSRLLVRVSMSVELSLSDRVFDILARLPLNTGSQGDGMQPLRDLDNLRSFFSSAGLIALFDLPWIPLYLAICFIFHVWIGIAALIGAFILLSLTLLTEVLTRAAGQDAIEAAMSRYALAQSASKNAEVLQAMGMAVGVGARWKTVSTEYMINQSRTADIAGGISAVSKIIRLFLQSAILGIGAYLVIFQEATAGIIIASSILTARALAPIELAIANWKGFTSARQSWLRLDHILNKVPPVNQCMPLPDPKSLFSVESMSVVPPGQRRIVARDVTFQLRSGQGLGIVGPSGSGKSSLARVLVGVWTPTRGRIRLDGAELTQWPKETLGRNIGYLPQDVELFAGTIAENISRFDPLAKSEDVIIAAQAANIHELILRFRGGYDHQIGEAGAWLSAGQRQRIALARALYGNPFLVVLDEPNSNVDTEGELALTDAILSLRARGGIAIVIAHRKSTLATVDHLLVLNEGTMQHFGSKDEVLNKIRKGFTPHRSPSSGLAPVKAIREG